MKSGKNNIIIRSALIFFLFCTAVWAQQGTIFAPYVSNIRTFPLDNGIKITWKNSSDIDGDLFIFRHTKEISKNVFPDAIPVGRISNKENMFVDHPGDMKQYFYLILGSNTIGELYEYFIPFRNASTLGTAAEESSKIEETVKITDLQARVENDSVVLSFNTTKDNEELIIYRHTDPISGLDSLINATRVSIISSKNRTFTDYPIPGITYYYTIQDAQKIKTGNAEFNFGQNSLDTGVYIKPGIERTGLPPSPVFSMRQRPLPYLLLSTEISTGRAMTDSLSLLSPQTQALSASTKSIVEKISLGVSEFKSRISEPDLLEPEVGSSESGEENTLLQIVHTRLLTGEYKQGIEELNGFLSLRRSKDINYRGRYYLGQLYYFAEDYQSAFLEFLIAEEKYYPQVKPWLEDIYYLMRAQNKENSEF